MNRDIFKTKTFWAGLSSVIGAVASVVTGEASYIQAAQVAVPAILAIFLRDGMITTSVKF